MDIKEVYARLLEFDKEQFEAKDANAEIKVLLRKKKYILKISQTLTLHLPEIKEIDERIELLKYSMMKKEYFMEHPEELGMFEDKLDVLDEEIEESGYGCILLEDFEEKPYNKHLNKKGKI